MRSDETQRPGASERRSLRSRAFRSLDAMVTAALVPPETSGGAVRRFLHEASNYERVGTVVRWGCRVVPGLQPWLRQQLERHHHLPVARRLHLLSYGSGATVYAVDDPPAWVLKIYRRSLGCSYDELLAIARAFQDKRERVQACYAGMESLFPPTLHLVLDGVLLGRPAAAALQAFVAGTKRDLFAEVSAEVLETWMRDDSTFRSLVHRFATTTLATYERDGWVLDLVGAGNVVVSQQQGVHRLHIVDYGTFERRTIAKRAATLMPQLARRLRRLERIAADDDRSFEAMG